MARLFISYAREDGRNYAEELCEALEGHDVWYDREDLSPGTNWLKTIEEAIARSDLFLPLLTRKYHDAHFAPLELARAFKLRKPLIPLRFHSDADVTLFLELTQYIDFSDAATFAESLRALRERIEGPQPSADAQRPSARWESMRTRAERQTRRMITPALYDPRVYVPRRTAEDELARFMGVEEQGFILLGDSGAGKSSLFAHWALSLLEQKHAVLFYDCSTLADAEIESAIARDLAVAEDSFDGLDQEAAAAQRDLVLIFDSISDYRGGEQNGAQVLIRRLHAMITRLPGRNIRVVLSCNSATWDRLERAAPLPFDRAQFHHSNNDPYFRLGAFTDAERDEAYTRYREVYSLHSPIDELSPVVRDRLREPLLLRMTAEAYRNSHQPLVDANLGMDIYARYFNDRVRQTAERLLVNELADEMLDRQSSALSIVDVAEQNEKLEEKLLDERPASAYSQLLDSGVLQEVRSDADIVVKFSHSRVAAYALATNLLKKRKNVADDAARLVRQAAQFQLAWETARALLLLAKDANAFVALARGNDAEQRALVTEAMVELHAHDRAAATELLQKLLNDPSEETRRTALKAAYTIGPDMRDFFLRAAIDGEPNIREALKNTLYLIFRNEADSRLSDSAYLLWRSAPGFTYDLLDSLLPEIRLTNPIKGMAVAGFLLDVTITIYINHCDQQEVVDRTADLLYKFSVERLQLDKFSKGILGKFEGIIIRVISRVFGAQVLSWMLFEDVSSTQDFFRLPAESRARLNRIADALTPTTDLAQWTDDLRSMLRDPMPVFSGAAAMAIAVHACHDFKATEPIVRRFWDEAGAVERRWLLSAFLVLIKGTPPEWVPFLEELTQRYLDENRADFLEPVSPIARELDFALVPLGIAYGKRGGAMPVYEKLIRDALAANDIPLVVRAIRALNGVGFYHPQGLFEALRPAFARVDDEAIANALIATLAIVRTLHFDAVDAFLYAVGAPESFHRRVDAAADITLVHRYIRTIGYFNNGVHLSLRYPKMRRCFSAGALRILSKAANVPQFVVEYTQSSLLLLRDANYRVLEWTRPE